MSVFTLNYRNASAQTFPAAVKRVWIDVRQAVAVQRTRHLLAQMDDRALSDIGLSRAEAGHEANRPIWDAGLR